MIEGNRVVLRPMKQEDIAEFVELTANAKENGDYFPLIIRSKVQFEKQFNETGFWGEQGGRAMITDKIGNLVGQVSYFKGSFYMAGYELGYQIFKREDHGKGYTTEAVKLMSAYLFQEYNIGRLQISMSVEHEGSGKVAEKCGYQFEGVRRKVIFFRGRFVDAKLYSLIREECPLLDNLIV